MRYIVYLIDVDDHVCGGIAVEATSRTEVMRVAEQLDHDGPIEVWLAGPLRARWKLLRRFAGVPLAAYAVQSNPAALAVKL